MPARDWRAGGAGADPLRRGSVFTGLHSGAQSPLGICAILLGDDQDFLLRDLQDRFPKARLIGADAGFEQLVAQVVDFIEAPALGLNPLIPHPSDCA